MSGRQVSTEGGTFPRWAPDGSELYWRNANQMMAAAIETSDTGFVPNQPRELFVGGFLGVSDFSTYDVNPNGDGFVMFRGRRRLGDRRHDNLRARHHGVRLLQRTAGSDLDDVALRAGE